MAQIRLGTQKVSPANYKENTEIARGILDKDATSFDNTKVGAKRVPQYTFQYNTNLTSVNLTGIENIGEYAFGSCTNLVGDIHLDNNLRTLETYAFQNCSKITNANLSSPYLTEIPSYCFYNCKGLTGINFGENIKNIGIRAFHYCTGLTGTLTIPGNIKVIDNENFDDCPNVEKVILEDGVTIIGSSAFSSLTKYTDLYIPESVRKMSGHNFSYNTLEKKVVVKMRGIVEGNFLYTTQLSGVVCDLDVKDAVISGIYGSFCSRGAKGTANKRMIVDFRKSIFTRLATDALNHCIYSNIYLPKTIASFFARQITDMAYENVFISNINPPPITSGNPFTPSSQSYKTTNKIFVPYNKINTYRTTTNWTTNADIIYGWAEENTFENGNTLPTYNLEGYALTWYDDFALTNQVTQVDDKTKIYYCNIASTQTHCGLVINSYQANVTLTDGTNTYSNGDVIPIGTNVTINAIGEGTNTQKHIFTLNGNDITSGATYTTTSDMITINCVYYDGTNVPFETTFANNTPQQIKTAFNADFARLLWQVGDEVQMTDTNNVTWTLRIVDMQRDRYEKSDGSGYANGVLEFKQVTSTTYQYNLTADNTGGWETSNMKNVVMPEIYNTLTSDWQGIIEDVDIPYNVGGPHPSPYNINISSNNKLFLPSKDEIVVMTNGYLYGEGIPFNYYVLNPSGIRVKQKVGTSTNTQWQTRSCSLDQRNNSYNAMVNTSGGLSNSSVSSAYSISPCFAI